MCLYYFIVLHMKITNFYLHTQEEMENKFPHGYFSRAIKEMEVGEEKEFSNSHYNCVKSTCSVLGFQLNRKYTTKIDRQNMKVRVKRLA